jgi:deoxycytidine triphosphate deaminase
LFLGARDIRRRLGEGSLAIDPFDERELSAFAIDLRLGTQFRMLPAAKWIAGAFGTLESKPDLTRLRKVELGEAFALEPGGSVLAVTLEYVHFLQIWPASCSPALRWNGWGLR